MMEQPCELQYRTQHSQTSGGVNGLLARESTATRKLGYRLNFEKADVSGASSHPIKVENEKSIPLKYADLHQKQQSNGKEKQNEELVLYMSNLPTFLEKGKNVRDQAFNVGVLDWRVLEKWQHSQNIGTLHSPSSSNTLSFSSTEVSSSGSSRGQSWSPARQKTHHTTLRCHLYGSPVEAYLQNSESSEENVCGDRFKDLKGMDAGTRRSRSLEDFRGKMRIGGSECSKGHDIVQASGADATVENCTGKQENVALVAQKDGLQHRCSSIASTVKKSKGLKDERRRSLSSFNISEASCAELSSGATRSFPPLEADSRRSNAETPWPSNSNISTSPSRGKKHPQEKPLIIPSKGPYEIQPSVGSILKVGNVEAPNVRNPSPTRRFSFSLGRIGRISSSSITQGSAVENLTVISGADRTVLSSEIESKSKANGTRRSSPLRRLLDPLMKPKTVSCDQSSRDLRSESTAKDRPCKSSNGRGDFAALNSVKMKLDLKHCKNIDAEVPNCSRKDGSSTVQALLQVSVRNGLPLFTFAVDNKSAVLAATLRRCGSPGKDAFSAIYTFFFIHETRKKNGSRVSQGTKERDNAFVPNVVAQMKVTDDLTQQNSRDESILKEFVLFGTESRQADQQTSVLQLSDELAALVVKIPKTTGLQNGKHHENCNDSSGPSMKQSFQNEGGSSDSGTDEHAGSSFHSQERPNMTVLLPGGSHGVPIKGEPSSLIRRWRSGGSCDCGGWDLGCRLRVLANHTQEGQGSNSAKTQLTTGCFELFSQGEEQDQKPVFSLSPFKDGIFSVEFNSSVKVLQAFSISLAVLSCLKSTVLSNPSYSLTEKTGNVTVPETDETKVYSITQVGGPVKYVSNPPLSPVGRV